MTKYYSDEEEGGEEEQEKSGMYEPKHYGTEDRIEEIGACDLQICQLIINGSSGVTIPCISIWSGGMIFKN